MPRSPTPSSSTCPPTRAGITEGALCQPKHQQCEYAVAGCYCGTNVGGPVSGEFRWVCRTRAAGCPVNRPLHGTPCSADANTRTCSYGECVVIGGTVEKCENGYWQPAGFACPL